MPTALMVASSSASACGVGFRLAHAVGILLQRTRVDLHETHGIAPSRVADAAFRPSFRRLLPEDTLRPAERADRHNCRRASLPGRTSGAHSPAKDDGTGSRWPRLSDSVAGQAALRGGFPSFSLFPAFRPERSPQPGRRLGSSRERARRCRIPRRRAPEPARSPRAAGACPASSSAKANSPLLRD